MLYKDILTKEQHNTLIATLEGQDFPWFYQPNITDNDDNLNPNVQNSFGFTHVVWLEKENSNLFDIVKSILDNFLAQSGETIKNLYRVKINLQTPVQGNSQNKYNGPHVDAPMPHKTLIYYPLDSDGDTFIFNEIYTGNDIDVTIKERITPIANSLYYLKNGLTYHSSSNPIITDRRYTINFNFD